MSKHNKVNAVAINKVTTGLCVVLFILLVISVGFNVYPLIKEGELTANDIFAKANEAMPNYEYAAVTIDRVEKIGEEQYRAEYRLTAQKDGSYCSYMFRDSEENELYQCWLPSISKDTGFDVYVYAKDYEAWVTTYYEQEPSENALWTMLTSAYGYTLMDETYPWFDTGDECYVLQMMSSSEQFENVYEELYIRKKDFLPMGIVLMATHSTDGIDHTDIQENIEIDGKEGTATINYSTYDAIVQKYSIKFSNEDLRLFEIPEETISEEDYMFLIQQDSKEDGDAE